MIHLPKSQPEPACLTAERKLKSGTHNCEGVLFTLRTDFKNKCYICESKEPISINTEHFKPHRGDRDLMFNRNNLFFCCGHCNNTKLAKELFDEILNCTIEADGVDTKIKYKINPFPKEKAVITAVENTQKVNNTVQLLNEIYNGTTTLKKIESENLRSNLINEIKEFQELLFGYFDDTYDAYQTEEFKNTIIRNLSPASHCLQKVDHPR